MLTLETNNKYKHTDIPRYLADALIYLPLSSPAEINITITIDLNSMQDWQYVTLVLPLVSIL